MRAAQQSASRDIPIPEKGHTRIMLAIDAANMLPSQVPICAPSPLVARRPQPICVQAGKLLAAMAHSQFGLTISVQHGQCNTQAYAATGKVHLLMAFVANDATWSKR